MMAPDLWHAFSYGKEVQGPQVNRALLKRIARYFLPYGPAAWATLAIILVSALLGLVPPLLLRALLDDAIPQRDLPQLHLLALGMLLIPLVTGLLGVLETYFDEQVSQGVMLDIRLALFQRMQHQSMDFFTAARPGEISSRLNNDVSDLQDVFSDTVVAISNNVFILLSTLVVIFSLEWRLALLAIAILPLFIFPARLVGRIRQRIVKESQDAKADISAFLQETMGINGFLMRRVFGDLKAELASYTRKSEALRDVQIRRSLIWRWFVLTLGLFSALGPAVIYWYGGQLVMSGALTLGTVVAFVAYLARLYSPVSALANVHVEVMGSLAVFDRLFRLLDQAPSVQTLPGARTLNHCQGHLRFENVTFQYRDDQPLLDGIDFEVRPGQLVALVGPSGAGKSTLSYLAARFYDPTSGRITLDGEDLKSYTLESLHRQIGMVTQEVFLFHTTLQENLLYAKPDASPAELEAACRKAHLWEMIQRLPDGMATVVGERGYRLSGGEKQRLALARVILKNPPILILDEATSSLDSQSEALIQTALTPVMRQRTTISIAHRLSTIVHADLILVLEGGRLVERGSHAELLAQGGLYQKLYDRQAAKHPTGSI